MHGGVHNNNNTYTLCTLGKKLENRIHSLKPCFIYSEISVDGHLKTPKDFKIKKDQIKNTFNNCLNFTNFENINIIKSSTNYTFINSTVIYLPDIY